MALSVGMNRLALYTIVKITDLDGQDRLDGRYPLRIGRRCTIINCTPGERLALCYFPREHEEYEGILDCSNVARVINSRRQDAIIITTKNSIYHLEVESEADNG